jgi:hypothetical protein
MMNSLSVHGKAKAFERLNRHEAIVSYSRTIELDDPTSYALLRIGKCHEKLGNTVLALKFSARLFMKILDGWIATDFMYETIKPNSINER